MAKFKAFGADAVKYISWESGKRVPSVDSFNKIMTALGAELTVVAK